MRLLGPVYKVRAQRLSASLFVPPQAEHGPGHRRAVLNAFRHHCSFHSCRRRRRDTSPGGAQRLSASLFVPLIRIQEGKISRLVCSTPFGIIVRSTRALGVQQKTAWLCSTPFGIIVRSTTVPHNCSRLTARCSTPFGIIVRSTSSGVALQAYMRSAQRLSASLFVPQSFRLTACMSATRAQRLSASLFVPLRAAMARPSGRRCAQRLSASLFVPRRSTPSARPARAGGAQRLSASLFVPRIRQRSSLWL